MKAIGIIGARKRDSKSDYQLCREVFDTIYEKGDIIVSGACPYGGDRFAEIIAAELGLTEENGGLILHRPEWEKLGRGAGYARNTYIARDSDILIAVVTPERKGGTEDTIKKIEKLGRAAVLVPPKVECFDPLTDL